MKQTCGICHEDFHKDALWCVLNKRLEHKICHTERCDQDKGHKVPQSRLGDVSE